MGIDVSLVVCDEFLFYDAEALPAILPTLATDAIFIVISSIAPNGDSPLLKVLRSTYPDGTNVFKMLNWIQVCPYISISFSSIF